MSTQSEPRFDLALFGNLTVDDVYLVDGFPGPGTSNSYISNRRSIGGLGNILAAIDGRLKVHVEALIGDDADGRHVHQHLLNKKIEFNLVRWDKPTTKAVIFSDIKNNERTSFVNWGCGRQAFRPTAIPALWGHLSYVDIIPGIDVGAIRKSCTTLSADFCLSNPPPGGLPDLGMFDVLFLSKTEADAYGTELAGFEGSIVCHTREETWITSNGLTIGIEGDHKKIDGIDVLGAGDAYCAGFILSRLGGLDMAGAARAAHEEATGFLLKRKGL